MPCLNGTVPYPSPGVATRSVQWQLRVEGAEVREFEHILVTTRRRDACEESGPLGTYGTGPNRAESAPERERVDPPEVGAVTEDGERDPVAQR